MHCIYFHMQPKIFLEMQFYKWILGYKGLVETFNLHLSYVQGSRSTDHQFEILLKLMLQHWIEIGEEDMAATFLKVHGKEPWLKKASNSNSE